MGKSPRNGLDPESLPCAAKPDARQSDSGGNSTERLQNRATIHFVEP